MPDTMGAVALTPIRIEALIIHKPGFVTMSEADSPGTTTT
jgi:hypothetical protein